jgi:hypothetical protein
MKSKHTIKSHVRFKSNFKKDVKGEIDGRDLAEFTAEHLRQKDYAVRSIENDEIWFTVNVTSGSIEYPLRISRSLINDDYWEISCSRTLGFFSGLFGKSEDSELRNLVDTLNEILHAEQTITDIKWYEDYDDLCDDYIHKKGEKRLSVVGKYLYNLFLPLWLAGWILALIGGIHSGKESVLLRIGVTICFLLIFGYFGLIAVNLWYGLISNIRVMPRRVSKKKWISWFLLFLFTGGFSVLALMFAWLILRSWLK